jgi:hypothetical protein
MLMGLFSSSSPLFYLSSFPLVGRFHGALNSSSSGSSMGRQRLKGANVSRPTPVAAPYQISAAPATYRCRRTPTSAASAPISPHNTSSPSTRKNRPSPQLIPSAEPEKTRSPVAQHKPPAAPPAAATR